MPLPPLLVVLTVWIGVDACAHPLLAVVLCLTTIILSSWLGSSVALLILPDVRRQTSGSDN